jgi:hypothetical protein
VARVAEQRLAVTERTDHDVALADLRHAAAGQFQGVVVAFVSQHLNHDDHPLLARQVLGGDA